MWGNIAIAFLIAFIVSFMATPYTIKIANKKGKAKKASRSHCQNTVRPLVTVPQKSKKDCSVYCVTINLSMMPLKVIAKRIMAIIGNSNK